MLHLIILCFLFFISAFGCYSDETLVLPDRVKEIIVSETGLSVEDISIDSSKMRLSSSTALLPLHEILVKSPLQSGDLIYRLATNLSASTHHFEYYVNNASILINQRIGLIPAFEYRTTEPKPDDFLDVLEVLYNYTGQSFSSDKSEAARLFFQSLPQDVALFIYHFVWQLQQSYPWMQLGRNSLAEICDLNLLKNLAQKNDFEPSEIVYFERLITESDRKSIFRASAQMCSMFNYFMNNYEWNKENDLNQTLVLQTPLGEIIVSSMADDAHNYANAPLLLMDCGGNDVYSGAYARSDAALPYSVVFDLGGSDAYKSDAVDFGPVCGLLGFAGLFDLGSEADCFSGIRRCFGYSFCGVSILYDAAGDSQYNTESLSLGASEMGISVLLDFDGNDTYHSVFNSQAYGGIGGAGLIHDASGNDQYIVSCTPVINPSAQLKDRNSSASQGFGTGRFGPNADGHSLSGGVGILLDQKGDDLYKASVFAQGAGIGFGIGILADLEGDDIYSALWYAMGSAAHQGCGFLIDKSGDDIYKTSHYMMGGSGTDFSLGFFADLAGNDQYHALNASLGCSFSNSFALFVDQTGNDNYKVDNGLGAGAAQNELNQTLRGLWPTFGFFVDMAGDDEYQYLSRRENGQLLSSVDNKDNALLFYLDIDGETALPE